MNPLTLKFLDKNLDIQYDQQNQYKVIQKYCMIGICIIFFLYSLLSNLTSLDQLNQLPNILSLIVTICSLLGIIIALKYSQFTNIGLFIMNLLIATNINSLPKNQSSYEGYIVGGTTMMTHTLLLFILQYPSSIINNCLLCFCQLFFGSYNSYISTTSYVATIITSLLLSVAIYMLEKLKRQSFFINQKDGILGIIVYLLIQELIISQCIGRPMFVFYYNISNKQLDLLIQKQGCDFKYLLDNTIYHKETLKQFIYKDLKVENQEIRYMRVKIDNKNHVIRLERKLIYFILTIETKDNFVNTLIQSQLNYSIRIQKYVQLMIRNISKIIGHSNVTLNYKLHHGLYQIIDYMHPKNPIGPLKKLFLNNLGPKSQDMMTNLSEKLEKFCLSTKNHHPININMNIQRNIKIACSPLIVNIYLLEIFKNLKSKQYYTINLFTNLEEIIFEINGPIKIDETRIFKQFSSILISEVKRTEKGLQFLFHNEPHVSFYYFK